MSFVLPLLNWYLHKFEKPYLARVADPANLRRSFDFKARLLFRYPRGVTRTMTELAGRPALRLGLASHDARPLVLYFHGGAYVFGSPASHGAMVAKLCVSAEARAVLPDYRKAPEFPFPAAVDDALATWDALLAQGEAPEHIILGGDSAGGGLCLALLAELIRRGGPLPAGAFAFSPLTDMTFSGESIVTNAASEAVLPAARVHEMAAMYLEGHDATDPRASPLFADFMGAPPIWLTASRSEVLFDDTHRFGALFQDMQLTHEVVLEDDLPHVWPLFHNTLPEARSTLRRLGRWIRQQTARPDES